jgi:hypothetical protein
MTASPEGGDGVKGRPAASNSRATAPLLILAVAGLLH